ncbi:putative inner membrane transporter YicL [Streptococcus infantis]|uniref:Putative inner membrane transporter YicL n=3 Tax=Streptococcus TaxID=1301 RepID=A0A0F3HKQ5_9STRE|nr:putative inner membrane transporter YicL [Streptococcus infantis]
MIFLHSLFSFFISWYNSNMNKYQKNIFKGTIYSLLSGLIWGICGILGEYFFSHYQVSSGWITSMRLLVAGSFVIILSSLKLRFQLFDIWRNRNNYLPFLAYAILGIFSVQFFFYLCVEYSNATTATILQFISPVFILIYNRIIYKKKASKKAIFYVLTAMLGVFLMATKGDFSKLSITPLALLTGLLSALGVMFNVILPQRFAKKYGFVPTVGWGMIIAGLFSNFLYPVYKISFQVDAISICICLTIAFLGTAFAFFLSMKAVSLVSPLVVSVVSASEPLSSAILSVLFLGMVLDGFLVLAMILIIVPMVFLSIEESKSKN